MAQHVFSVGDRVTVTAKFQKGATGEVVAVHMHYPDGPGIAVQVDDEERYMSFVYAPEELAVQTDGSPG